MEEIWKDIENYEGLYQVSNLGRVRSIDHRVKCSKGNRITKGKVLKPIMKDIGYYVISLHKDGIQKQCFVHRLVADAFCIKNKGQNVVDHINTNTKDNRAANLRWTTPKGNMHNPVSEKRRYDALRKIFCGRIGAAHPKSRPVLQLTIDGKLVKKWDCASDAVRECGFDSGGITHCCKGKSKSHKGFKWKYDL